MTKKINQEVKNVLGEILEFVAVMIQEEPTLDNVYSMASFLRSQVHKVNNISEEWEYELDCEWNRGRRG